MRVLRRYGFAPAAAVALCGLVGCIAEPWPEEYVSETQYWNDVAAGGYHSCAVEQENGLRCWGCEDSEFDEGQCDPPYKTMYGSVSAGPDASCTIDGGQLTCWGSGHLLPTADTLESGDWDSVSVGGEFACGLRGDEAICWGRFASDETIKILEGQYSEIAAGDDHACAVTTNKEIECLAGEGEAPWDPPSGLKADRIAVGNYHACAVNKSDGRIQCWGCDEGDDHGQCSVPDDLNTSLAAGEGSVAQIATGKRHTCALSTDGAVQCWGCDDDSSDEVCEPWFLEDQLERIDAGREHTCGVSFNGHIVCWGDNSSGQRDPP